MKVRDLIAALQGINQDLEVVIQKDEMGNNNSPLDCVGYDCVYVPNSPTQGRTYDLTWKAGDYSFTDAEWTNLKRSNKECIILFPME
jgi:hypothetical protein